MKQKPWGPWKRYWRVYTSFDGGVTWYFSNEFRRDKNPRILYKVQAGTEFRVKFVAVRLRRR